MSSNKSESTSNFFLAEIFIILMLIGTTVAITPWFSYDPINLPKQAVLVSTSFFFIPLLIQARRIVLDSLIPKILFALVICFIVASLISMSVNQSKLSQQFWGTWGRANGFLSYFSLLVVLLTSSYLARIGYSRKILRLFLVTSYAVTSYTFLQFIGLEPFDWSLKLPFAFFGNINFMSAFLGLACTYIFSLLLYEKLVWTAKLFFYFLTILNLWLIYSTESIQGIAIFAIGASMTLLLWLYHLRGIFTFFICFSLVFFVGLTSMLGSAGVGPLGKVLVQQTVLFRTDYWRTGITAFRENFWFGVGLDSFGDYYRQYRDFLAATRTGPQRTVNTSHNVFIDLFANGGVFVGTFFVSIVLLVLVVSCYRSFSSNSDVIQIQLLPLFCGWIFFLSVSINQLGVTIWGFVFGGMIVGQRVRKKRSNIQKSRIARRESSLVANDSIEFDEYSLSRIGAPKYRSFRIIGLLLSACGLMIAAIPMRSDAVFLKALKTQNGEEMKRAIDLPGAADIYRDKYLDFLARTRTIEELLSAAREMTRVDDRNIVAWNYIANAEGIVSRTERLDAVKKMLELDAKNQTLLELFARIRDE